MQRHVKCWRQTQITDAEAKLIFYSAFVDAKLDAPRGLLPEVHRYYFEPQYPEFSPRTDVEPVECVYKRVQEAGSGSAVQGDGQAGRIPRPVAQLIRGLRCSDHARRSRYI